jgi:hypothetical protein
MRSRELGGCSGLCDVTWVSALQDPSDLASHLKKGPLRNPSVDGWEE